MEKSSGLQMRARFPTADIDALIPELVELVDTEAVFTYAWQMDEDDPFPGGTAAEDPRQTVCQSLDSRA